LQLLVPKSFNEALEAFVTKDEKSAIQDFVEETIESIRDIMRKEKKQFDDADVKVCFILLFLSVALSYESQTIIIMLIFFSLFVGGHFKSCIFAAEKRSHFFKSVAH